MFAQVPRILFTLSIAVPINNVAWIFKRFRYFPIGCNSSHVAIANSSNARDRNRQQWNSSKTLAIASYIRQRLASEKSYVRRFNRNREHAHRVRFARKCIGRPIRFETSSGDALARKREPPTLVLISPNGSFGEADVAKAMFLRRFLVHKFTCLQARATAPIREYTEHARLPATRDSRWILLPRRETAKTMQVPLGGGSKNRHGSTCNRHGSTEESA